VAKQLFRSMCITKGSASFTGNFMVVRRGIS
jgi:hypothetical protein